MGGTPAVAGAVPRHIRHLDQALVFSMLLKLSDLEAIRDGRITLVFRRWSRPSVKAGGTLKTKIGMLRIGRIDDMDPADVTEADARSAGFGDRADFERWLATMKPGHLFQRIEVSYLGPAE